jgi:hypothetical protein
MYYFLALFTEIRPLLGTQMDKIINVSLNSEKPRSLNELSYNLICHYSSINLPVSRRCSDLTKAGRLLVQQTPPFME